MRAGSGDSGRCPPEVDTPRRDGLVAATGVIPSEPRAAGRGRKPLAPRGRSQHRERGCGPRSRRHGTPSRGRAGNRTVVFPGTTRARELAACAAGTILMDSIHMAESDDRREGPARLVRWAVGAVAGPGIHHPPRGGSRTHAPRDGASLQAARGPRRRRPARPALDRGERAPATAAAGPARSPDAPRTATATPRRTPTATWPPRSAPVRAACRPASGTTVRRPPPAAPGRRGRPGRASAPERSRRRLPPGWGAPRRPRRGPHLHR